MPGKLIYHSNNSKVFVEHHKDYGDVIVKYLNEEYPSPGLIRQFFNEFEILKELSIDGIRKAYECTKTQNQYIICLEYVDGQTIRDYAKTNPPLKNILSVFRSVVKTLSELHSKNVIHKDISPGNIMVYPDTLKAVLIDFGNSTRLNLKTQHLGNPEKLEGTLAYISPEQTGRVNRVVDYRTDLYSLGIVMYEVFSGSLPFKSDDPLELVHAHIATTALPLHNVNNKIPSVLSRIVSKLLKKNAEDRYQSSTGLLRDLDICIEMMDDKGLIEEFDIAQQDVRDKFQIAQKLYGREAEIDALLSRFDEVSKGPSHLMLVSGYSGTGKSALVAEIFKPITEKRGYFIEGKFDQFQRGTPYYAIIQAFNSYIHLLLTEDEKKLAYYRDEIQSVLGSEGQVLTELIPSLEMIIGEQPDVPEVNGVDARNRLKYVFLKFLSVISSQEHPIVLFIDDLQWADSASLDMLNALLQDKSNKYFMCICAYRDNEVDQAHPFIIMVDELKANEVAITEIHVDNLKFQDVHQLIADSLMLDKSTTKELTQLVYDKTQGNAFFVTQFLKSLYEEELLIFNTETGRWKWDLERMRSMNITDNVVEFMAEKIKKVDHDVQEILISAASVGNVFELKTLAIIHETEEKLIKQDLHKALVEGWILMMDDHYRFAHDRIQQAVYSLISEEKRQNLHLQIGRHLLDKYRGEELEEKLFDVVNQLNSGINLVIDDDEKLTFSRLNLEACKKAKHTSAFGEAYSYAKHGIELLGQDPWKKQYDLTLGLHKEISETAFLITDFNSMDGYIDTVLDKAEDLLSRVEVYEIRINAFKAQNRLIDALTTGFDILAQLGEKIPRKAGPHTVLPDLIKTILKLRRKSTEDILRLPDMENEGKKAAMRILANIAPSSYWVEPNVFPHIILRIVQLSLKYGLTAVSAFGFATYGVIQIGVLGKNDIGYKFGKVGLKILERFDAKEWIPQVYNPIYGLIFIWGDHVKTTLKPLLDSYHIGLETGAIEFACINSNLYCINSFLIGKQLNRLEQEANAYSRTYEQYKQEINIIYNEVYRQAMLNLLGKNIDPLKLVGEAFDEEKMFEEKIDEKTRTGTFYIYFLRIMLANYFGDSKYAWDNIYNAEPLLDSVLAKLELAHYAFHVGLACASYYPKTSGKERSRARKLIKTNIKKLKTWAKFSPENYLHKQYLLEAEWAALNGNNSEARKLFDLSIMGAAETEYLNEEAIANERAGSYHKKHKNDILSEFYIKNAFQTYRYWGAKAKLDDLSNKYPTLIRGIKTASSTTTTTTISASTTRIGASLDLNSIIKASTALSSEIVLSKLLDELMKIVSENVGANKAWLLLYENQNLYIEAILKDKELNEEMLLQRIPIEEYHELPKSIITYIRRTKKNVIISNASDDATFSKDSYIQASKPKSIFGFPILNKGEFIGILYLENNIIEGAFTEESIHLISMLSGQIAVSIENARHYEGLEQKVNERTKELADEKKKSDDLLLNILPAQTAQELKDFGKAKTRKYDMVTVMFTDFKDFTQISETMTPEVLVEVIDSYFEAFDIISRKYNIEKIKTIGDSYMCVAGLPIVTDDHAYKAVLAALEIKDVMSEMESRLKQQGKKSFEVRIGLNSGPVVAGVVGLHKFAYDIWGDTVNTASRLESNSEPSRINISGSTYALVKEKVNCTYRGKLKAKNKGEIEMYFIDSLKN